MNRSTLSDLKIQIIAAVIMLLSFVLVSCNAIKDISEKSDPEPEKGEIKIYCTNTSRDSLHWENHKLESYYISEILDEVCDYMQDAPKNKSYVKAIPDGVEIISCKTGTDGQLVVNFSAGYLEMDSITEALCRAAVVKTFCQINSIKYVEFNIDGLPLTIKDIPAGLMSADDFVDNSTGKAGFDQNVKVTVYLTDEEGKMLKESILKVYIDGTKPMEEVVLEELIAGPLDTQPQLRNTINSKTKIRSVRSYDGTCYVDFSEEFMSKPLYVKDEVAIYSVVNTLCELPGVTKVKITVAGTERKYLGNVALNEYLSYRPELITIEKAGESTGGN